MLGLTPLVLPLKLVLTLCTVQEPAPQVLELYNALTYELVFPLIEQERADESFIVPYPLVTQYCTDYVVDEYTLEDTEYCNTAAQKLNDEINTIGGDIASCEIVGVE